MSKQDKRKRRREAISRRKGQTAEDATPRCGLCGKTRNLIRTECCGNWICDDEGKYVLFSYGRNSCSRNHRRYTLCGSHATEGHPGDWKNCPECRDMFDTEMYVWYGTNEYNFEKLPDPPAYEPTRCVECGRVIILSEGGYSCGAEGYRCPKCTVRKFGPLP